MNIFLYGQPISRESQSIEYKILTIEGVTNEESHHICKTNIFDMNDKILDSIVRLFGWAAEYGTSFLNEQISGSYIMGVDDFGFVHGFPYLGKLPEEMLTKLFYEKLNERLDNIIPEHLVSIKFIKLEYLESPMIGMNPYYVKFMEDLETFKKIRDEEVEIFQDWYTSYRFVNRKMYVMLNCMIVRPSLIEYIERHMSKVAINKETQDKINNLIDHLKSSGMIPELTKPQISAVVNDVTNPYYWMSEWKDHQCIEILKLRPTMKTKNVNHMTPYVLVNCVTPMIPYWMTNNKDLNLYVIQIDFTYDYSINKIWKYMDPKTLEYVVCRRKLTTQGEPFISKE
jgi:hypothetical protein